MFRLATILCAMAPLFILVAILWSGMIWLCALLVLLPGGFILLRIHTARKQSVIKVGHSAPPPDCLYFMAFFGFKAFTVYPPDDGNPFTLITRRDYLVPDEELYVYRLDNKIYIEKIKTAKNSHRLRPYIGGVIYDV